jgi:hypothetical protein
MVDPSFRLVADRVEWLDYLDYLDYLDITDFESSNYYLLWLAFLGGSLGGN